MLPALRLVCSCHGKEVLLRQGELLPPNPGDSSAPHENFELGEASACCLLQFDSLCLACGALQAQELQAPKALDPVEALRWYQKAVASWEEPRVPTLILQSPEDLKPHRQTDCRRCQHCEAEALAHPFQLLANLQEATQPSSEATETAFWMAVFERLSEHFEDLDELSNGVKEDPHAEGEGLWDRMVWLGENLIRATLRGQGPASLNRGDLRHRNLLRRRHREFLEALPKAFRNDFTLKSAYMLALDCTQSREALFNHIRSRMDLESRKIGLAPTASGRLPDLPCPWCESGVLLLRGFTMKAQPAQPSQAGTADLNA